MAYVEDRWKRAGRDGKGRRWRVRYTDPAGKERSRSFDRKLDADRFRSTAEADMVRGTWVDPQSGKMTLRQYAEGWLAAQAWEESTRERVEQRFRTHILPTFGDQSLVQVSQSPSAIQAWLKRLPISASYKRSVFTHLQSCLSAAVDDGRISRNPCQARSVKLERPPKRRLIPWTGTQIAAVREALPPRYRALCDAGALLGLRQGEAFGLSPDDIDWLRNVVHIRRQVRIVRSKAYFAPPKGDRERDVPLPEQVKLRLAAHLAAFPAVPVTLPWKDATGKPVRVPLIFTTGSRRPCTSGYLDVNIWKPAIIRAGITPGRTNGFHALRHYFASSLLLHGIDIRTVAEYLGHSDPGFTLRVYTHFITGGGDRMRQVIDGLAAPQEGPDPAQTAEEGT